jgi:hypothetical protein
MRPTLLTVVTAVLVVACSSAPPATSTAPSPKPVPTPVPTRSGPPSASPGVTPTPSASPSPTPSPSPLAVTQAPSGSWSAVRWLETGPLPLRGNNVWIRGWSRGYVALEQSGGSDENGQARPVVIRASLSSDGLHWTAPTTLETGFEGEIAISSIVEGPNGLLAVAFPYGDTCGGPARVAALWSSPDGRQWERLAMPTAFTSGRALTIDGGGAGFVALGVRADDRTQAIWTSATGRSWASRPLPTVSSGTLVLDQVASVDGGFVLVGSVLGDEGCGGAAHIRSAAWFSKDGSAWVRATLPGASTDPAATLQVQRLMGRVLVLQLLPGDEVNPHAWISPDGRTWTSVGDVSTDIVWASVSDGVHSVQALLPDEGIGPPILTALDANAARVTLRQDGTGPVATTDGPGWTYAVGPTGVLAVATDGSASWLGLPS